MVGKSTSTDDIFNDTACASLLSLITNKTLDDIDSLLSSTSNKTSDIGHQAEFDWDTDMQSHILGAFFYGYVLSPLPAGYVTIRYGFKWPFGLAILAMSLSSLVTPFAARAGPICLIAVRFIQGIFGGATFPTLGQMIGKWAPKMERSSQTALISNGAPLGTVVGMAASGWISDSMSLGGWPSVYYVFGFFGCIWFVFWIFIAYENPEEHPRISQAELMLIQENKYNDKRAKIAWLTVFRSYQLWALIIAKFGYLWGFLTLMGELPTYLSNVLHFNLKENGVLSSLPAIFQAIFAVIAGIIADKMRQRNRFSITTILKIFNSIGFFGAGVCVALVAFVGCRPIIIVALLCIALGINGFSHSGFLVGNIDLCPEIAGTITGISACLGNVSGFLALIVAGKIVSTGQTVYNWSLVFGITSVVYFVTGLVFIFFGSGEKQPWITSESKIKQRGSKVSEQTENPGIRATEKAKL